MQAKQVDDLNLLVWSKTKDAEKGENAPRSLVDSLMGKEQKEEGALFATGEEFEDYWRRNGGG